MNDFVQKVNNLVESSRLNLENNQITIVTKSMIDQLNRIIHLYLELSNDLFTDELFSGKEQKQLLFKIEQVADFLWNQWWKTNEEQCDQSELNYLKNVRQLNSKIFFSFEISKAEKGKRIAEKKTIEEFCLNFKFESTWIDIIKYINSNNTRSSKLQNSIYLTELILWFDRLIHITKYYIRDIRSADSLRWAIVDCLLNPFHKQCVYSSEIDCRPIDKFYIGTCAYFCTQIYEYIGGQLEIVVPLMHAYMVFIIHRSKYIDQWSNDTLYCMRKVLTLLIKDYKKVFPKRSFHTPDPIRTELFLLNHEEYMETLLKILTYEKFKQKEISSVSTDEEKLIKLIIQYFIVFSTQPTINNNRNWLRAKKAVDICLPYIHPSYTSIHTHALSLILILIDETALERLNIAETITRHSFDLLENKSQLVELSHNNIHYFDLFPTIFHYKSIQDVIGHLNKIYYFLLNLHLQTSKVYEFLWTLSFSSIIRKQLKGQMQMLRISKCYALGLLWTLGDSFGVKSLRSTKSHFSDDEKLANYGMQQDIILDCSLDDQKSCQQIYHSLVANGFRVWFPYDSEFETENDKLLHWKLQACDSINTIVVYLSEHYERSNTCRAILQYALKKKLKIVPIITDKYYRMQNYLEEIFDETEVINFTQLGFDDAIDLLSNSLRNENKEILPLIISSSTSITASDLFKACKNNAIKQVKEYLSQMELDQINQVQRNGNTALHVAVSKNNKDIIRLLLRKGASRSIRDAKHKMTAYERASNDMIKCLFKRSNVILRFLTDLSYQYSEWTKDILSFEDQLLTNSNYCELLTKIQHLCSASNELFRKEKMIINWFLNKANDDPTYILRAFTSVTNFSMVFNKYLLENTNEITDFHRFIYVLRTFNSFESFIYLGETYRGMVISKDDLIKYSVGTKVMMTALLSTTKDFLQAEMAALDGQGDYIRRTLNLNFCYFPAICIYRIKHRHTAYAIQQISEVPDEQEVLILPCSMFLIKIISEYDETSRNGIIYQFELEECD